MKKIMVILVVSAAIISCNNSDTAHAGIPDSSKVTVDTPKAVIVDSSKMRTDSSGKK
jgi:hypothetical protein